MAMKIDVLTLFPDIFSGPLTESIIKRAREAALVGINIEDLRRYTGDKHHTADDKPYGGGSGMVMKAEPVFMAVDQLRRPGTRIILMSPQGARFSQPMARQLSGEEHLIFICGHYEGIDERVRTGLQTMDISIGDYILTNGSLAAAVVIDAIVRLIPGVLGNPESVSWESFQNGLLEYPQYTRPAEFRGMKVPKVLLSGDHKKIEQWREEQARRLTRRHRPDMYAGRNTNNETVGKDTL